MEFSNVSRAGSLKLHRLFFIATTLWQLGSVVAFRAISVPIRIDCGSATSTSNTLHQTTWTADAYFRGGTVYTTSGAAGNSLGDQPELTTLRAFPSDSDACYDIPLAYGRYLVRLGVAYNNYDGLNRGPAFAVLMGGVIVDYLDLTAAQQQNGNKPYFGDYIVYANTTLPLCLQASRGIPILSSLEILPADTLAYNVEDYWKNAVLRTAVRLNGGGPAINAEPDDPGFRSWRADFTAVESNYTQVNTGNYTHIDANATIANSGALASPDYLPTKMFQTARAATSGSGNITGFAITTSPVSRANTWYLRFYFAELDTRVQEGDRLFDIFISGAGNYSLIRSNFDIVKEVGALNGTTVHALFSFSSNAGLVSFVFGCRRSAGSKLQPILNGLELFEVINTDPTALTGSGRRDSRLGPGSIVLLILVTILGAMLLGLLVYFCIVFIKGRRARAESLPARAPRATSSGFALFGSRSLAQTQPTDDTGVPMRSNPYERSSGGNFDSGAEGLRAVELSSGR